MRLFALGVNHVTATVALRERLVSRDEAVLEVLASWRRETLGVEVAKLSTCNRYEIYVAAPAQRCLLGEERLLGELGEALELDEAESKAVYLYDDEEAARHLFRVTASLDSLVLGEDQIQAQVKAGYAAAVESQTTGPVLNHLFHRALAVGKRIRTETDIARSPVSVATAGVSLAKRVFGDLSDCRVLVLGTGEMARLALRHLKDRGARQIFVGNRTLSRAVAVAGECGGEALALSDVEHRLGDVDLVVAATGASEPILSAQQVSPHLEGRIDPLLLIDLGLPRNLAPDIHDLDGALLYDLDDLHRVTDQSKEKRKLASRRGEDIAFGASREFGAWLASRKVVPVIQELLETSRDTARRELVRALKGVNDLPEDARLACERAVVSAVNKVLHNPMISLRGLPKGEDGERTLRVVRDLFQLEKVSGGER